ncbi:MAG: hypothetical protein C4557_00465 [Anaerolineaceae bacterium]|jgi:hypothetical protein|nr:MAG: hypothetical protein C4557_00465 [Anaerolineaceae bacterium]
MLSRKYHSRDFLWLSIALMPLIGIALLLEIQPQDFWWLMRVGQETVQNGAVPIIDTISWSQAGRPIVYQPWLAGVILYLIYNVGGITCIFLLRGILIAITYGMIWVMARDVSNARLATILVFILGIASANNWSVRSQLPAYPLFVFCLWSLLHWQNGNKKYLWVLPVVTLLWANLHGSFILPFVLTGAAFFFGKGERKTLAFALGLMFLATLINPQGISVWKYIVFMLNSPSDHWFAFEWAPPSNVGWQMNIFFAWLLAFAPLAAFSPRKLSMLEWVWFLGFGWLALSGLRYVIWFHILLAIFTAVFLSEWAKRLVQPTQTFPTLNYGFGIFMLTIPLIFLPGLRERWMGDSVSVYEMSTTPLSATEWLAQHPHACSNLWADYAFGGYLSFALPSCKPWMDSRFNAYPPDQWSEYVQVSRAEDWQEMFDREGINLLLLSTAGQPKLVGAVSESNLWCEEYHDEYAVIFSRCEAK